MTNGPEYWKAAATLKRVADQIKSLVPEVRRLDAIHDPAERRDAKLTMAIALGSGLN